MIYYKVQHATTTARYYKLRCASINYYVPSGADITQHKLQQSIVSELVYGISTHRASIAAAAVTNH